MGRGAQERWIGATIYKIGTEYFAKNKFAGFFSGIFSQSSIMMQ
jgi:hypothetical protein